VSGVSTQFAGRVTLLRDKVESFERYPFSLPAIRTLDSIDLHPKVTFLVGENGSGKSTLLEAMAVALGFNPEGGSRNFNFGTRDSHSELHEYLLEGSQFIMRDAFADPDGLSGRADPALRSRWHPPDRLRGHRTLPHHARFSPASRQGARHPDGSLNMAGCAGARPGASGTLSRQT
jgi:hypothetical protein